MMKSVRGINLLGLILFAWLPSLRNIYRQKSRSLEPFREIAQVLSASAGSSDLILIHSIPSGVLGIARYVNTPAALASWVGQLGTRRVPESLLALAHGRTRILFVKVHKVGQAAPEEEWLRRNGEVSAEKHLQAGNIIYFEPKNAKTF